MDLTTSARDREGSWGRERRFSVKGIIVGGGRRALQKDLLYIPRAYLASGGQTGRKGRLNATENGAEIGSLNDERIREKRLSQCP